MLWKKKSWDGTLINKFGSEAKRNATLRNSHQGECFILGNGPSLKRVDLDKLKDNYVITCNMFAKLKDYEKVKTDVHVVVDSVFFQSRTDGTYFEDDVIEEMWESICNMDAKVIVPFSGKQYIEAHKIDKRTDVYYLNIDLYDIPDRKRKKIRYDITKEITSYVNVVQFAIIIALNMGFKKINLLGCDTTGIYGVLDAVLHEDSLVLHAYDEDKSKELYKMQVVKNGIADQIYWESFSFLGYERLFELCKNLGVELVNLTDVSLIDSIPRGDGTQYYKVSNTD